VESDDENNKFNGNKYVFRKGNYEQLNNELKKLNWKENFENKSINECYTLFMETYKFLCDQFIPE
jgi:glutamate formiminotransferase